jgi:hypothetical protein
MEDRLMADCNCGSRLPRRAAHDARGIFLTYLCDRCETEKLARFRPDVLTDPDYWTDEPVDDE